LEASFKRSKKQFKLTGRGRLESGSLRAKKSRVGSKGILVKRAVASKYINLKLDDILNELNFWKRSPLCLKWESEKEPWAGESKEAYFLAKE